MIENLTISSWYDEDHQMKAQYIFLFGSKLYAITKLEAKKQLQDQTDDPRDYNKVVFSLFGNSLFGNTCSLFRNNLTFWKSFKVSKK